MLFGGLCDGERERKVSVPTYVYWCEKCDVEWEQVCCVADREDSGPCPECGGGGKKIFTPFSNHAFRSRWIEGISSQPVYVESHKQLNKICEKSHCHIVSDDRRKQKRYYERRGMVEEGKRVCK